MIIYSTYKKNHPVTPSKQVVNVVDLGYLGIEKDYPVEQLSLHYHIKRKETNFYQMIKKSTTKFIPTKRG